MPEIKVIRDDIYKSADGLQAVTVYDIGNQQRLTLRTSKNKSCNWLQTTASVATVKDGFETFAMGFGTGGGDFYERLENPPCPRASKRLIEEQHRRWTAKVDLVMDMVRAHYYAQAKETT